MTTFAADLERFGPAGAGRAVSLAEARVYTRRLAETHYENFPVVSRFVPPRLRQHFANVYAYCRWSDDLADETGGGQRSLDLLDWWQEQLDGCFDGDPSHPVMTALAETVQTFAIPREPFCDLLWAFRRDQVQPRYATFAELCDYCRGSANPVGRIVLYLCDRFNDERAELSDAVCTGLQLTNFWQDVAIDVLKGRIYLPLEDLQAFGVPEQDILDGRYSPEFADLLAYEARRAEDCLLAGVPLAGEMPGRLKIVVAMFAHGGLAVLRKIRRIEYNVFQQRPMLARRDFATIAARAIVTALGGRSGRRVSRCPLPNERTPAKVENS
jgi:squalene synthase HpnC